MQHLISIDDLSISEIENILQIAEKYLYTDYNNNLMFNKKVVFLFFESSTRTSLSFKIAVSDMEGKLFDLNIQNSATKKGESFIDTINTILSMKPDFIIIRHDKSGICNIVKNIIKDKKIIIINAGDGTNEHPTQALIDLFTIKKSCTKKNPKIFICGDILHSRVAHSNFKLFKKFDMDVNFVAPPTLLPKTYFDSKIVYYNIDDILNIADVVILLRLQYERIKNNFIPSHGEYYKLYGLDKKKLQESKNKNLIIMHPGPINRGLEINSDILDLTLINNQVENGVAIRKAIFEHFCSIF